MLILGLETSCDETAASIIDGRGGKIKILSNIVSSQIEIHKQYHGVVPELAAREHVVNILPVIDSALKQAGFSCRNFINKKPPFKALAVTAGPGLITSLLISGETARALACIWQIPLLAVNHIEGHIAANFIDSDFKKIKLPAIILTVSGGHTNLIIMKKIGKYKIIGETLDDAAGEAFDKAAKMMNIGYPGGPIISQLAKKANPKIIIPPLPRPMLKTSNFNFSFSGLKTALLYSLQKDSDWPKKIPEYCKEFQSAIIDVLIFKTLKAAKKYKAQSILLAGGVSANQELRKKLEEEINLKLSQTKYLIPDLNYCTDNAAMIAAAGYLKFLDKKFTTWKKLKINCNLEL